MMAFSSPLAERAASRADAVVLSALTVADAERVAAVIRTAFATQSRDTTPPSSALSETAETITARIAAGGGFGVFADGRAVAVALWQVDGDALVIARVCALPEWRGRGLGRSLIAACEVEGRARGLGRARLRVRLALPENERLFSQLGFARIRIEAHAGFDAPTVAVLEKRLG